MPFVPSPRIIQIVAEGTYQGQEVVSVHHCHLAGAGAIGEGALINFAVLYKNWFDTTGKKLYQLSYGLEKVVVRDLTTETSVQIEYTTGLPILGTRAGGTMPTNLACVLSKRTGVPGRSYRGRTYLTGQIPADVHDTLFNLSYLKEVVAAFQALFEAWQGLANVLVVVYSKINNGGFRGEGIGTPIKTLRADIYGDSMYKRLPKRGS
jgi:hypothetical protein